MYTDDQDVVELLHAVQLGQQLVDHSVVDPRAARHASTLFTNGVDLIEDDDVEAAVGAQLSQERNAGLNTTRGGEPHPPTPRVSFQETVN